MIIEKPFVYYVHDKNGSTEFQVSYNPQRPCYVRVHYPKIEGLPINSPLLGGRTTFKEMHMNDFGYMLFAYDEDEFLKFDDFLKSKLNQQL